MLSRMLQRLMFRIALLEASLSQFREQVAKDYIHRVVMSDVEDRLTAAIDRLGDRLDRILRKIK